MPLNPQQQHIVRAIARASAVAGYSWQDRGVAPIGYTEGIALVFAQCCRKLVARDEATADMAQANTHDDDVDALSWYNSDFAALGMTNEEDGVNTLRHLFVLLMGLGTRESSGRHCEGRDMSADNVTADTAEAGLYQTSYNAHNASPLFDQLMDEYSDPANEANCQLGVFEQGVTCSESDWENYGDDDDDGYAFQELCKSCPAFAVETCAITLRNLRQHYGPINRKEAELRPEADAMLFAVQLYIEGELHSA